MKKRNLIKTKVGIKYGRLTVLEELPRDINSGKDMWLCQCECGNLKKTRGVNLRIGATKSCGCLRNERVKESLSSKDSTLRIHGLSHAPEYKAWAQIKQRCYNKNNPAYLDYGGRGIKMHKSWINSFETFYNYMGPRPSPSHSLGRINNDGHYRPGNLEWQTKKEQVNNRRPPGSSFAKFGGGDNSDTFSSNKFDLNKKIRDKIDINLRFGRLLVKKFIGSDYRGHDKWECLCDCGRIKIISGRSLRSGNTKSCGCLQKEKVIEKNTWKPTKEWKKFMRGVSQRIKDKK